MKIPPASDEIGLGPQKARATVAGEQMDRKQAEALGLPLWPGNRGRVQPETEEGLRGRRGSPQRPFSHGNAARHRAVQLLPCGRRAKLTQKTPIVVGV